MNLRPFYIISVSCLSLTALAEISLVPRPLEIREAQGSFTLNADAVISYADESAREPAEMLAAFLRPSTGFRLPVQLGQTGDIVLQLSNDPELGEEGYKLRSSSSVVIEARNAAGFFYGVQTLRQLLPPEIYSKEKVSKDWEMPAVEIRDVPRFKWRGMHLDVSRHFLPPEWIKKYIDLLAVHKLNVLHWHLTDDQGWRIEIKKYPKLTEVGAWRSETLAGHRRDRPIRYDGVPHGGFYTQEQIRDIVTYAEQRHVTIVPEIEIPGHSQAALAAYPELGCKGGPYEVRKTWGVSRDIYCAGNPDTFTFWKEVLDEVCELFPSEYIHTGGDEAPKKSWQQCPKCQDLMKKTGADDEHALQVHVTLEMEKHLAEKGRRLIGWDEIFEEGLSTTAAVMWWHKNKGAAITEKGNGLVYANSKTLYFNMYQSRDTENEPIAYGKYIPIETVYNVEPVPEGISAAAAKNVMGAQGQLWTEYVKTPKLAEYMIFPRACALAEMVWLPADQKNLEGFMQRMSAHALRLDALKVNYRPLDHE